MSKRARKNQQAEEQTPPTLRGATAQVILLDDAASFPQEQEREEPILIPGRTEGTLSLTQTTVYPENLVRAFQHPQEREEKVRALAYDLWLKRGSPIDSSPETDWLEAERLTP